MKICIVGGGIFGCTAAIKLHDAGHDVQIIESSNNIMNGATLKNQQRLHRGYHYPRAFGTAVSCKQATEEFTREYSDALINHGDHYYAIAKEGSVTSPDDYLRFLKDADLDYAITNTDLINSDKVSLIIQVREDNISAAKLRQVVRNRLNDRDIPVTHYIDACDEHLLDNFDHVVVACYSNNNHVLEHLGVETTPYQYELVEKPILRIPDSMVRELSSAVVMDGPFCSIDPDGLRPNMFLLGHVKHAIIKSNTGTHAELNGWDRQRLYETASQFTKKADQMVACAEEYFPGLEFAQRMASYFTLRAVLPNVDMTDERPTIVKQHNERVTSIFSGKIPTAVRASKELVANLCKKSDSARSLPKPPTEQAAE